MKKNKEILKFTEDSITHMLSKKRMNFGKHNNYKINESKGKINNPMHLENYLTDKHKEIQTNSMYHIDNSKRVHFEGKTEPHVHSSLE